jgi:ribosomal protein L11 methyltransferase
MQWQKLILLLPGDLTDTVGEHLTGLGALAVTCEPAENEALFEPLPGTTPLWQHTQLSALFDTDVDLNHIMQALQLPAKTAALPRIEIILDQDWQKACQDAFPPRCFKQRLWVCPTWHELPEPNQPHIFLDPGLAFGTGAHPTTALCLEWLAEHIQPGDTLIDYGCGSGILAIAALKLGATEAWAVDNDPQALTATQENALLNHCTDQQLHVVSDSDSQLANVKVDVLVANILANPLIQLAPQLLQLLKPGGKLVLSGILSHQADAVAAAYQPSVSFLPATLSPLTDAFASQEEWLRLEGILSRV